MDALSLIRIGKWTLDKDGLQEALEHIFWSYKVFPPCSIKSTEGRVWVWCPKADQLDEDLPNIYKPSNDHNNMCSSNQVIGKGFYGEHPGHEISVFTSNFPFDSRLGST